ncbi:MAG: hypothetical protein NZL90_02575 [Aquificaceae bacterium]|nr:hypothetical protein [Aquificaceae bacterium]MDW8237503.1 hypothetical protein [Aquificaceae bacterium]
MQSKALKLIGLFGLVSLLADFTYEGARAILAPYLQSIGAGAFLIGFITGFGEAVSYLSRYSFGLMIERGVNPKRLLSLGYFLNISVGVLGIFQNLTLVSVLFWTERLGKAMRSPARDIIIKDLSSSIGYARGFGIYGFFDQVGALLGPIFASIMLYLGLSYGNTFLLLSIPGLFATFVLLYALKSYDREILKESSQKGVFFSVWGFGALQAGILSFGVLGLDLLKSGFSSSEVAIFYALGMAFAGIGSLAFGEILSRSLALGVFALMVFSAFGLMGLLGSAYFDALGVIFWGLSLGGLESSSRTFIAIQKGGGKHFGALELSLGLGALMGGIIQGGVYELSPKAVLVISIVFILVGAFGIFKSGLTSK